MSIPCDVRRRAPAPLMLAVGMALVAGAGAQQQAVLASPPLFYYYNGEKVALQMEPSTISAGLYLGNELPARRTFELTQGPVATTTLRLAGAVWRIDLDGGTKLLTEQSLSQAPAAPGAPPKPAAVEAIDRQRQVLEELRDDAAVEWAYPALRNPDTGTLLLLTPRIIVGVDPTVAEHELAALLPDTLRVLEALPLASQFVLELTTPGQDDPLALAAELVETRDWVRWAEPDFIQEWSRTAVPNDTLFANQWHLQNTGQGSPAGVVGADGRLPQAWDTQTGDGSIVIAIIDDGIELAHPDLASRIWVNPGETPGNDLDDDSNGYVDDVNGWDFIDGDSNPNPDLTGPGSHGTSVAGVAAAAGNNSLGVSGACQNCKLLSARVFNATSAASDSAFAAAIAYAGAHADVLNNSWGGGSPTTAITTAIQNAVANGRGGLGSPTLFANGNSASGYYHYSLGGFTAGAWTFTWTYHKDVSISAGLDTAFLDNVIFPDGVVQSFETCSALPAGWTSSGDANWTAVNNETRASSSRGGKCSIRAGAITHSQTSTVEVTRTLASGGTLLFEMWPSSERVGTTGPIVVNPSSCYDYVDLTVTDSMMNTYGPFFESCGTWSNQGNPLQDGVLAYPSSLSETISVGAATNFDRRSDYSQWGSGNDFVCHSNGGSLAITTTDVAGGNGYSGGDYTSSFGGTSSATPLCSGIAALALTEDPTLTAGEVRTLMRDSTRKIGPVAYTAGYNNNYGYGAVSAYLVMQNLSAGGCPYSDFEDLSSQTVTTTETFGACDTLTAGPSFAINSPGDVLFEAGNMIVLKNGFSVGLAATFTALLDPALAP